MATIHQPEPKSEAHATTTVASASSNRLLASHHSVLEMLHSKQDDNTEIRKSPSPISLNFSTTSWQSIGEYLSPRPTSSVLSNSDFEDDNSDNNPPVSVSPRDLFRQIELNQDDDDKTIEINLNSGIRSGVSVTDSNFVFPDIFAYRDSQTPDDLFEDLRQDKILIIGHKKTNFFKMLDEDLRSRFTLDLKADYKLILVIFDGLLKIGNILNFVKRVKSSAYNTRTLFIPVFRNINLKILNKILAAHCVDLLCPPINYDNKKQVESLLNFLSEDFLLEDPAQKQIEFDSVSDSNDYQLIRLSSNVSNASDEEIFSRALFKKSVIVRHHTLDQSVSRLTKSGLRSSKKLRSKKAKKKKYFLLAISLSLGVGIGVTSAYFISLWRSELYSKPVEPNTDTLSSYSFKGLKKAHDFTLFGIKRTGEVLKKNLGTFKDAFQGASTLIFRGVNKSVLQLAQKWDHWVVDVGSSYNNALLWVI